MPTYEEARSIVLESVAPVGTERVETGRSLGRTLAEDVAAPWPLPFCDNSAMDGYAVRADDCRGAARLKITGYLPAGGNRVGRRRSRMRRQDHDRRANPPGCDAVIPSEETSVADDHVVVNGKGDGPSAHPVPRGGRAGGRRGPSGRDASPPSGDQHAGLPREDVRPGLPEGPGRGAVHRRRADRTRGGAVPRHDHQQQQRGDRRRRPGSGRGKPAPRHRARRPGKPRGKDLGRVEGGRPDHHRRGVGGRPGPGPGGAGADGRRVPLLEGRHQAGRPDRLRDEGREAGLLPPREPGVRAGHVRGVRPARASPDDGAKQGWCGRWSRRPSPERCGKNRGR